MALGWKALLCVPVDTGGETNSMSGVMIGPQLQV